MWRANTHPDSRILFTTEVTEVTDNDKGNNV